MLLALHHLSYHISNLSNYLQLLLSIKSNTSPSKEELKYIEALSSTVQATIESVFRELDVISSLVSGQSPENLLFFKDFRATIIQKVLFTLISLTTTDQVVRLVTTKKLIEEVQDKILKYEKVFTGA